MTPTAERIVLVTGGSKGIGRACVEEFAMEGACVAFTWAHDKKAASDLAAWGKAKRLSVTALRADATRPAAYAALQRKIAALGKGKLDVLVNNAGDAIRRSSFIDSGDALWRQSIDLNLLSAVRACHALLPLLLASPSGVIINVSSIAASTTGAPDSLHYGVAKAALETFTRGLAKEMSGSRVRVAAVAPSAIDTGFQKRHSSQDRLGRVIAQTPLGRIGTAHEVAAMVRLLASPEASYVSGAILPVTGGR
jgi:3-oxoacyl-[acyl-carrier protein] reductase